MCQPHATSHFATPLHFLLRGLLIMTAPAIFTRRASPKRRAAADATTQLSRRERWGAEHSHDAAAEHD